MLKPSGAGSAGRKGGRLMIVDGIGNIGIYRSLGGGIRAGLDYLAGRDFAGWTQGRYGTGTEGLYTLVQEYRTKPRAEGVWESHRKYVDIQFLLEGTEAIDVAPVGTLAVASAYEEGRDAALYDGEGGTLVLHAGDFAVFYPDDAHRPGLTAGDGGIVRKVVVKVPVEAL